MSFVKRCRKQNYVKSILDTYKTYAKLYLNYADTGAMYMGRRKKVVIDDDSPIERPYPAMSPDARENQMIALATALAEKQLIEGTASSQVITHYLKLGTSLAQLEKAKLQKENELLVAKAEAIQSAKISEELYQEAIAAMKSYVSGGE
jgi:hypothetical protein